MFKLSRFLGSLIVLLPLVSLLLPGSVWADAPVTGAITEPAWRAVYWNNTTLSGQPALQRDETVLDYNWGLGSPHPDVSADNFSVRWERVVELQAGTYLVSATSDDGVRVYINGELVLNGWWDHGVETFSTNRYLPAGHHEIRVEYYERGGAAVIKFALALAGQPPPPPPPTPDPTIQNWRAEYFNDKNLGGAPVLVRDDPAIDFDWGNGSPAPGIVRADEFSVRWTRTLYFEDGEYRFTTETDDGVRLYVDGGLMIDQWGLMSRTKHSRVLHLGTGYHTVRMEYFENLGDAFARLTWGLRDRRETVGNLITCVPPNPPNYAWIRVYRRDPSTGEWYRAIPKGVGSIHATGYLKLDGLPVDVDRYGGAGEPYWIEQWIEGEVTRSVGNTDRGEAEFRIRPGADNYTPWQCPPP